MIRITFELLPGGDARRARTIGLMEIANLRTLPDGTADYAVVLTKCPPFKGALKAAWRKGLLKSDDDGVINQVTTGENSEAMTAHVTGHHRTRRGVYDLVYRGLRACGLQQRNPDKGGEGRGCQRAEIPATVWIARYGGQIRSTPPEKAVASRFVKYTCAEPALEPGETLFPRVFPE